MNCKPGDLAIVVCEAHPWRVMGNVVRVLNLAPARPFKLPDGYWQTPPDEKNEWVVDFGKLRPVPTSVGTRQAQYGVIPDRVLRPLRGDASDEKVSEECYVPTSGAGYSSEK